MYVKLVIGKQIVNIVSAYAPQVGLSAEEKDDFWDIHTLIRKLLQTNIPGTIIKFIAKLHQGTQSLHNI